MSNEKKQVKTNDLFASAFKSAPDKFWDLLQEMKYTYTTMSLMARLYKYFSSENGRQAQKKLYYYCDLKNELGKNSKPASRNTIENSIKEIKESNLFIVNEDWKGKEKTVCFYIPNEKNISIFEKVENNLGKFHQETFEFFKENNIIDINKSSHLINLSSQINDLKSHSFDKSSQVNDFSNQMNDVENKKIKKTCQVNDFSTELINLDNASLEMVLENSKESYIKEPISKEALLKEPFLAISNDSTLEKKLLESELKVKAFLESEVKGKDKEQEQEITFSQKDENELDRLKGILISDYQMYEAVAEKLLKQYSTKAINECIDLTIDAEVNDKIKSTPRDFLMNKLKYWVEKKESTQESSSPYKKVVAQPGEKDFIDFCFSKKINYHISQNNLNASIQNILEREIENKNVFISLKESFTKEQLSDFISNFKNKDVYAYKYTEKIALFWQFWNDLNEMDKYIEKRKIERENARLYAIELGQKRLQKDDTKDLIKKIDVSSDEKILSDLQDDLDSEDIPY